MAVPILEIRDLTKKYRKITAVNGLSLDVNKGNVYGILGPNGSGKTTTLGMVTGIIMPTDGEFRWFEGNYKPHEARQKIGTLLETPNFYPYLNAVKNLEIVAHIKKVKNPNIDELLELVNLTERKKSPFKTYSLGMKQRLAIAGAMIGNPEVLIFDEPTNGLDPQGIAEIREVIKNIASVEKTILMASHILDEVEKTCSHVAIIKRGKLLAQGTVGAIISDDATVEVAASDMSALQDAIKTIETVRKVGETDQYIELSVPVDFNAGELNRLAFQKGIVLTHLVKRQRSLESEFLEITSQ
jgi:ABC-2 type transport system ATP-binding protein